jgi:hypothetical protein
MFFLSPILRPYPGLAGVDWRFLNGLSELDGTSMLHINTRYTMLSRRISYFAIFHLSIVSILPPLGLGAELGCNN